jgi:hypothetical protein
VRIKRLSTKPELTADRIMRRTLAGTDWLISRETRIQSVLDKDRDSLSDAAFNLYSRGSFDFVVYHHDRDEPEFVLEFDGIGHDDSRQTARDLIKNSLCVSARLPLLRIGHDELRAPEKVSVLEWLVATFARESSVAVDTDVVSDPASAKYVVLNLQTGEVTFASRPPEPSAPYSDDDPDNYVLGANGGYFDSEHPFPANAAIANRILQHFGISVGRTIAGLESSWQSAPFRLRVHWPGAEPPAVDEGTVCDYVVSEREFTVRPRDRSEEVFKGMGRARFACALKLPPRLGTRTAASATATKAPRHRSQVFPIELSWLDPWGAARELALYDALVQVERWAGRNLRDTSVPRN